MTDFSELWLGILDKTIFRGKPVSPRGRNTLETLHSTIEVDMQKPVLMVPERKLSYQFMAAEAYWILSGDDTVAGIAPWNKNISNFSDDGERFYGAYGPKILGQLDYVVEKLTKDPTTRQAGLTIWRENPPATKDYPCTVAIFFSIRDQQLNCHVFMRSSDIWMGLPYDVFNFSMLGHYVCGLININRTGAATVPGTLYLTTASSHIYEDNIKEALVCLKSHSLPQKMTPKFLWVSNRSCIEWLKELRDTKPGDILRWWEVDNAS